MRVMILDDEAAYQARIARALMAHGFQVVTCESLASAEAMVGLDLVDLLILGERVQGQLSHSVARLGAERELPSIFLTDRQGEEVSELFALIPSVYSIMGRATAPGMVARIAERALAALPPRIHPDIEEEVMAPVVVVTVPGAGAGVVQADPQASEVTAEPGNPALPTALAQPVAMKVSMSGSEPSLGLPCVPQEMPRRLHLA